MFTIYKKQSPNKIRDINIAIEYHNTGQSLRTIGDKYGMSSSRVYHNTS